MVGTGATDVELKVIVPPPAPAIADVVAKPASRAMVVADVFGKELRAKGIIFGSS
jgi:hypothetical protein